MLRSLVGSEMCIRDSFISSRPPCNPIPLSLNSHVPARTPLIFNLILSRDVSLGCLWFRHPAVASHAGIFRGARLSSLLLLVYMSTRSNLVPRALFPGLSALGTRLYQIETLYSGTKGDHRVLACTHFLLVSRQAITAPHSHNSKPSYPDVKWSTTAIGPTKCGGQTLLKVEAYFRE